VRWTRGSGTHEELAAIQSALSGIIERLTRMDEKLDRIVRLLDEEGDDDEAAENDA
jgi:hypothetical protein